MTEPLTSIREYTPTMRELVMAGLRLLSNCLGSYMDDLVLVGGLVPALLPGMKLPGSEATGTRDLDIGFSMGVFTEERYEEIATHLRTNGFGPALNDQGNPQHQTWTHDVSGVTVDFLVDAEKAGVEASRTKHLAAGFAAFGMPGLELALHDRVKISIAEGPTPSGNMTSGEFYVCGPGSFVVLKALAYKNRNFDKDPYDLYLVLRYHDIAPPGIADLVHAFRPSPEVDTALQVLRERFRSAGHVGPAAVSRFYLERDDADLRQDAYQTVKLFLDRCTELEEGTK